MEFKGIDASLAPIPQTIQSIGLLYEFFGVSTLGNLGSLSITSRLTDFINKAFNNSKAKKAGFNGVMFSPLEDDWLAKQSIQGILDIQSLMLYSQYVDVELTCCLYQATFLLKPSHPNLRCSYSFL